MSQLMKQIRSEENMTRAYKKVKANKGASGIDKVNIENIDTYLKENWGRIKERIQKRKYKPSPVLRIDLEKFFDKVSQDKPMTLVGSIKKDPDTESLNTKFD